MGWLTSLVNATKAVVQSATNAVKAVVTTITNSVSNSVKTAVQATKAVTNTITASVSKQVETAKAKTKKAEIASMPTKETTKYVKAEDGSFVPESFYTPIPSNLIQRYYKAEDGSFVPESFYKPAPAAKTINDYLKESLTQAKSGNWTDAMSSFVNALSAPVAPELAKQQESDAMIMDMVMVAVPAGKAAEIINTGRKTGTLAKIAAAFAKAKTAIWKDIKKHPVTTILLTIFATTEIPNYFNMRIFARNTIAENQGLAPEQVTFPLNEQDNHFKSLQFDLSAALKAKDYIKASGILKDMKKTRDTFKSIVENKSSVLKQIGQYETELSNLEYFDNIITRTEEEIALPLKAIQTELPESLIVKVREIIDGDTIRAHWDAGGITLDIRLVGVNTPEKGEIGSKESTAWIAKQIYGREVEIKIDPKNRRDIYDRVLGTIFYEGENINLKEIEEGWAFYYRYERNKFMNESEYAAAEEKAKKNKKGIWALVVVTGTVAVSSSPTHAKIFLDDVDTKLQTAETIKNVEVGKHKIKISLEGYQDYVEKVQVLENKKVEVYKKLEKLTPEQAATMIGEPGVEKIKISKEDFFKEIKNFYSGRMYMSKTEFTNLILKYDVSDIQSFIDEVNSYYPGRMYLSKKELIELGTKYGLDVAGL